jgi:virulence-associated protein VapD
MYAIAFDMSVDKLRQYYGEPYNNAYFEIGKELRQYGFYNVQGSVYMSKDGNMTNLVRAVTALKATTWIRLSVRDIRAFRVEDWSDFTEFVRNP